MDEDDEDGDDDIPTGDEAVPVDHSDEGVISDQVRTTTHN